MKFQVTECIVNSYGYILYCIVMMIKLFDYYYYENVFSLKFKLLQFISSCS